MEKMFWTTGEVVEMLDVTPSLIRFWETKFDILAPRKTEKGRRRFSADDVANLKTVYHLVKERGMTLDGAARHLKANRRATDRDAAIAERLGHVRAMLVEIREEISTPAENLVATEPAAILRQAPEQAHQHQAPEPVEGPAPSTFIEQTLF